MPKPDNVRGVYRPPLSTYRLQLNLNFTFANAERIVDYLDRLGVTDLYASPYLQARAGSLHGYDISDHSHLNEELGGREAHDRLMAHLREREMGHLLDIVPNHMGIGEQSNRWWMDVLENGPSSPYAAYFDIDWHPLKSELAGKVLLPILGEQFGIILEKGELQLHFDRGRFRISYHEHTFPVAPRSTSLVLRAALDRLGGGEDDEAAVELESIVTALEHLPARHRNDEASVAERRRESRVSRRRLTELYTASDAFRAALDAAIAEYNGKPGVPASFDAMEELLEHQAYRLAFWRVAVEEINYRRFFDVNDLAGVRVEVDEVFESVHALIFQLMEEGKVTGLRIDHPDGLFDPPGYLRDLQREAADRLGAERAYILVEKILTGEERLPPDWPVAGTVGYDFLNRLNGLFVDGRNAGRMTRIYEEFVGERVSFTHLAYLQKKLILRVSLASELNVLTDLLDRISEKNRRVRDFTRGALRDALRELIASFPVYRTYIDAYSGEVGETDRRYVEQAARAARRRNRATSSTIFDFVRDVLLLEWPHDLDAEARSEHALFVMKFQQLTGPVMAKGVEDTSFYIFNRLVSLNEVGGEPDRFGVAPGELHRWLERRAEEWPLAMNTTSTHDTKRSEDVRARINLLSEIPEAWASAARRWRDMNEGLRRTVEEDDAPAANDEYLLYQTLVGVWPIGGGPADRQLIDRVCDYMLKATREAKVHTSWINPNEEYEDALVHFIRGILDPAAGTGFVEDFQEFMAPMERAGMVNALAQVAIKLAGPGVPDIYQGQEIWDFSLVDPDNRRPIDYDLRSAGLDRLDHGTPDPADDAFWSEGLIKLDLTRRLLQERRADPELFHFGAYQPVAVEGERSDHVFAFARVLDERAVIVAVPRLPLTFREATGSEVTDAEAWRGTHLVLPASLRDLPLTTTPGGSRVDAEGRRIEMSAILETGPVGLVTTA